MPRFLGSYILLASLLMAAPCLCQYSVSGPEPTIETTPTCRVGAPGTLQFSGGAQLEAAPDVATVDVSIQGNGSTAAEAQDAAAEAASNVLNSLIKLNGITPEDISTTSVSVSPNTNYNPTTGASVPNGFGFQNSISVTVNNVTNDLLAEVLDRIVSNGGNLASINDVSLSLSSSLADDLTNQARRLAVQPAREIAALYVEELDVTLGALLAFTDSSSYYQGTSGSQTSTPTSASAASLTPSAASTSTPVQLGTQAIGASVNLVYTICTADAS